MRCVISRRGDSCACRWVLPPELCRSPGTRPPRACRGIARGIVLESDPLRSPDARVTAASIRRHYPTREGTSNASDRVLTELDGDNGIHRGGTEPKGWETRGERDDAVLASAQPCAVPSSADSGLRNSVTRSTADGAPPSDRNERRGSQRTNTTLRPRPSTAPERRRRSPR